MTPFHLAFPVRDLEETRQFYGDTLGCEMGRSSDSWVDFSLFGHQMSAHLSSTDEADAGGGAVDGRVVPIPHFGVVLHLDDWKTLAERLEKNANVDWIIRPNIRFAGEPGEQATLFIRDPSGNALEFKGFADMAGVFAT